jgi:hypothetical protein
MCWSSVVPEATASNWAPRQMPNTGMRERRAAARSASSNSSRTADTP